MNRNSLSVTPVLVSLVAAAALVACNRTDEPRTAGQAVDRTVAKVENKSKEIGSDIRAGTEKAIDATDNKVRDAAITAEVKSQLAKDPDLSALRIDVDTAGGRVALKGVAPTKEARDRAEQLAKAVTGVSAVNNELSVKLGG